MYTSHDNTALPSTLQEPEITCCWVKVSRPSRPEAVKYYTFWHYLHPPLHSMFARNVNHILFVDFYQDKRIWQVKNFTSENSALKWAYIPIKYDFSPAFMLDENVLQHCRIEPKLLKSSQLWNKANSQLILSLPL